MNGPRNLAPHRNPAPPCGGIAAFVVLVFDYSAFKFADKNPKQFRS